MRSFFHLFFRKLLNLNRVDTPVCLRRLSSVSPISPKTNHVWVSLSNNIYQNLALEDWIYRNADLEKQNILMVWRNTSCVVVGRHQNPWVECDVATASQQGVTVARRNSGGGTVYHDLGNMCLTFFTARDFYDRVANLKFVASVLRKYYDLDVDLNDRDDILLEGKFKISGTAAKLSGKKSYHHCTLLLDVDCNLLNQVLMSRIIDIESRATESVRSKVKNLRSAEPTLNYEDLVLAFTQEFVNNSAQQGEIRYIMEPLTEDEFPGISEIHSDLKTWTWVYGKTPKFNINRSFAIHSDTSGWETLKVNLTIEKGFITSCEFQKENISLSDNFFRLLDEGLVGIPLKYLELMAAFENVQEQDLLRMDLRALETVQEYFENLFR